MAPGRRRHFFLVWGSVLRRKNRLVGPARTWSSHAATWSSHFFLGENRENPTTRRRFIVDGPRASTTFFPSLGECVTSEKPFGRPCPHLELSCRHLELSFFPRGKPGKSDYSSALHCGWPQGV